MTTEKAELAFLREENARLMGAFRKRCEDSGKKSPVEPREFEEDKNSIFTVVVVGGSGDLATKKLFPSLFLLFAEKGMLPEKTLFVGYARSEMSDDAFHKKLVSKLPSTPLTADFLAKVHYLHGSYEDMHPLIEGLARIESTMSSTRANRVFYLSIPPTLFVSAAKAVRDASGPSNTGGGWTRIVIEKPFGHDLTSSRQLRCQLSVLFDEQQVSKKKNFFSIAFYFH